MVALSKALSDRIRELRTNQAWTNLQQSTTIFCFCVELALGTKGTGVYLSYNTNNKKMEVESD